MAGQLYQRLFLYRLASQWKNKSETRTFTLHDLKVVLSLNEPKGIEAEQCAKVSMFQKYVLDIAVSQINQNTNLHIGYEPIKKGCFFESIRFQIKQQELQQLLWPFE